MVSSGLSEVAFESITSPQGQKQHCNLTDCSWTLGTDRNELFPQTVTWLLQDSTVLLHSLTSLLV